MVRLAIAPAGARRCWQGFHDIAHAVIRRGGGGLGAALEAARRVGAGGGRIRGAHAPVDAELGYGLPVHGALFTGTPVVGLGLSDAAREVRLGWRLTPAGAAVGDVSLGIEAARRESAVDLEAEHRIGASLSARSPGVLCSALPPLLVAMRNAPAAAAPPRRSNATKAPSLFGFAVANREQSAAHKVVPTSFGSRFGHTPRASGARRAFGANGVHLRALVAPFGATLLLGACTTPRCNVFQ